MFAGFSARNAPRFQGATIRCREEDLLFHIVAKPDGDVLVLFPGGGDHLCQAEGGELAGRHAARQRLTRQRHHRRTRPQHVHSYHVREGLEACSEC
jgi:hypothetical protein